MRGGDIDEDGGSPEVTVDATLVAEAKLADQLRVEAFMALGPLDETTGARFDRITDLVRAVFEVPTALVILHDRDHLWIKSTSGMPVRGGPARRSLTELTTDQDETLVVEDARAVPRLAKLAIVASRPGVRFYAGHPLYSADGQRLGALCLLDERPRQMPVVERRLLKQLASWVEAELVHGDDLGHAARVQAGLLPSALPAMPGYELAGACIPSRAVGGDFFDWYQVLGGTDIALTLGDVMGKGVGAGIIAATTRAVLRSVARRRDEAAHDLNEAARSLDADLQRTGSFVTVFHARLDQQQGLVRYADAGHGLTLVVRSDGSSVRLTSGDLPLGIELGTGWRAGSFTLEPGDTLVTFSDGLLDLLDGTMASIKVITELVRTCDGAQDVVDTIVSMARRRSVPDDVTVLALRRRAT